MTKIIRTPYRISLLGGGTDYPEYFHKHDGLTIGFTINKYSYLMVTDRPKFTKPKYRISYSKTENTNDPSTIEHPVFHWLATSLEETNPNQPLTIHHEGDLPSGSGMGTSSALTVGIVTMTNSNHYSLNRLHIAKQAIKIEREVLNEPGGHQDQYTCVYGGIRKIHYSPSITSVISLLLKNSEVEKIESHMFLIWTGIQRRGYVIESRKIKSLNQDIAYYREIHSIAKSFCDDSNQIDSLPNYLNQVSELKEKIYPSTHPELARIKRIATKNGAQALKILGAGGGGFLLCWAEPSTHKRIKAALSPLECIHFKIDYEGTKVIYEDKGIWE